VKVNENVFETTSKRGVPIRSSVAIQVTTYGLMAVNTDLVMGVGGQGLILTSLLPSSTTNWISSYKGTGQRWTKHVG
jgi:hypothetical protein